MEIITGVAVVVIAAIILAVGGWLFREKLGWFRSRPDLDVDERIRQEVKRQLDELQAGSAAPPTGAPPVDTEALAAQATERTESLLAEAVALKRQGKERDAIECLLTAYDMDMPRLAKAQLHTLAGNGFFRLSELEEAEGQYRLALDDVRVAAHRQGEAAVMGNLGLIYAGRGDFQQAEVYFNQGLAIHRDISNHEGEADLLSNLAILYGESGDADRSEELSGEALAIYKDIGSQRGESIAVSHLANVKMMRKDWKAAEQLSCEGLRLSEELGDRLAQANDIGRLGIICAERGQIDQAEAHIKNALTIQREIGNREGEATSLGNLGHLYERSGQHQEA